MAAEIAAAGIAVVVGVAVSVAGNLIQLQGRAVVVAVVAVAETGREGFGEERRCGRWKGSGSGRERGKGRPWPVGLKQK